MHKLGPNIAPVDYTSLEFCLRTLHSVWAHTECLNKSGGIVCQCVIQIIYCYSNVIQCYVMFNTMLMLFKKEKYKLGRQSVLETLYTVEIKY